jgi:hypothetical protein
MEIQQKQMTLCRNIYFLFFQLVVWVSYLFLLKEHFLWGLVHNSLWQNIGEIQQVEALLKSLLKLDRAFRRLKV